jgi:hypothetical protein
MFDEKKKELVRSIGFGGILELPQDNKVSHRFTLWLLSRLDPESRTIVVNGEPVAKMVDFDVKDILGIPAGQLEVTGLVCEDARAKKVFMQQMIGAAANETNSLLAAGRVVKKQYSGKMTKKQCDNFKVSFVVFVVGHFLAPTTRNNVGNSSFWGALRDPDQISQYNWAEYVLKNLVDAAIKVQEDIEEQNIKHNWLFNFNSGNNPMIAQHVSTYQPMPNGCQNSCRYYISKRCVSLGCSDLT